MDHPNTAKVFDAGATETGRPFFVMELVRGTRISEYGQQTMDCEPIVQWDDEQCDFSPEAGRETLLTVNCAA